MDASANASELAESVCDSISILSLRDHCGTGADMSLENNGKDKLSSPDSSRLCAMPSEHPGMVYTCSIPLWSGIPHSGSAALDLVWHSSALCMVGWPASFPYNAHGGDSTSTLGDASVLAHRGMFCLQVWIEK